MTVKKWLSSISDDIQEMMIANKWWYSGNDDRQEMMFIKKFDQDVYTLDTDRIVDVMDTYSVDGAEYIKKEFCIKANLKALETATEKLN